MNDVKLAEQVKNLKQFPKQILKNISIFFQGIVKFIMSHSVDSFSVVKFASNIKKVFS
jgi:hypothetical protein